MKWISHLELWVYPMWSIVITLVGPIVSPLVPYSVFKYLREFIIFSNFLHEVKAPYGHHKIDRARFLKKYIWWSQFGENPILGAFLMFWNFLYVVNSTLSNTSQKLHVLSKSGFGCIVETRPPFLESRFFCIFGVVSRYASSDAGIWNTWNLVRI